MTHTILTLLLAAVLASCLGSTTDDLPAAAGAAGAAGASGSAGCWVEFSGTWPPP